jgi:putative NADH-flavin reductase
MTIVHVAVVGATGMAGSAIVSELLARQHQVTAIARNLPQKDERRGLTLRALDASSSEALADALKEHDAVVSAVKFKSFDTRRLIEAVKRSGVRRYIVVGGAGSLRLPSGTLEMDGPGFPEHVKPEAGLGKTFLEQLRAEASSLDWTFLSPARIFKPGERTGHWRESLDDLLFTANGESGISVEDYAAALADELEKPAHIRRRFTVGY